MNNLEFLDYKQFPEDPYVNAIAEICIDGKHLITYCQKKMKDGGMFWCSPTVSATNGTEKFHFKGYKSDSVKLNDQIIRFIEQNVKQMTLPRKSETITYPHTFASNTTPSSMSEVDPNGQLPF